MNDEQFFTILAANTDAMHGTAQRAINNLRRHFQDVCGLL